MEKITVLVNAEFRERVFSQKYYDRLAKLGEVKVYDKDDFSDKKYYLDFVKGSTVIVTSWDSPQIDKDVLEVCPDLKGVIHGAGSIKPIITDEFIERKLELPTLPLLLVKALQRARSVLRFPHQKDFINFRRILKRGCGRKILRPRLKIFTILP